METWFYEVVSIDGDYANLKRKDIESDDLKLVARALLPAEIYEGCKLKYEFMQYEMIQAEIMWKIKHIFDGDYGCEALAPNEKPKVSVTIVNDVGEEKRISVEDDWLTENNLGVGSEWSELNEGSMQ